MSVTRGKREPFPCGHRGLGKELCHRCQQADQMLAKADKLDKSEQAKATALREEAKRR